MKKIIATALICLVLFVSLAALINNPTFSAIQNQNAQVHVKLTHEVTTIYQMSDFNQTSAQYSTWMTGNETLINHDGHYVAAYSFDDDPNGFAPPDWSGNDHLVIEEHAGHSKVVEAEDTVYHTYVEAEQQISPTLNNGSVEFWIYCEDGLENEYELQSYFEFSLQNTPRNQNWMTIRFYHGYTDDIRIENFTTWITVGNLTTCAWTHVCINFSNYNGGDYNQNFTLSINQSVPQFFYGTGDTSEIGYIQFYGKNYAHYYLDAIDMLWKSGYAMHRNIPERVYTAASYVSPVIDLGEAANYYYNSITCYADIPGDSDLDLETQVSNDNITWTGFAPTPLNCSIGAELGRYAQFLLNFTASSDGLETPSFFEFDLNWTGEINNTVPVIGDIQATFDNDTMEATISVYVTDPDNDTLTIFLCLPLGDIIANQTDVINGTIVAFFVICEYDTSYEYYLNVTDSEDSTQSSLFGFSTGAEPEEPPEDDEVSTPTLTDWTILLFGTLLVLAIAAASKKRPT